MPTTADTLLAAILAEPARDDLRLMYADWLEEHGEIGAADLLRSGRMPQQPGDYFAAGALSGCSYLPGSFEKRFARDYAAQMSTDGFRPTVKQWACAWRMVWRYRKQLHTSGYRQIIQRAAWLNGKASSRLSSSSRQTTLFD